MAAKRFHHLYGKIWTIYSHIWRHCFFFLKPYVHLFKIANNDFCLFMKKIENRHAADDTVGVGLRSGLVQRCFAAVSWRWQMSVSVPSALSDFFIIKLLKS